MKFKCLISLLLLLDSGQILLSTFLQHLFILYEETKAVLFVSHSYTDRQQMRHCVLQIIESETVLNLLFLDIFSKHCKALLLLIFPNS